MIFDTPEHYEWSCPDQWVAETTVDEFPMIIHPRELTDRDFRLVLSHTISDIDLGTDVIVTWDERGARGGATPEEFTVGLGNLPALIAVLQRAHAILTAREGEL